MTALERSMKRSLGYGDVKRTKPKKSSKASAVKYADHWFSLYIRARDPRCVTCGKPTTDCSHVFRRHSYTTRWDTHNAYGQCRPCHFKHHTNSEFPLQRYALWRIGQDAMDELWLRSKQISKFSADTIRAFGDSFKAQMEKMK